MWGPIAINGTGNGDGFLIIAGVTQIWRRNEFSEGQSLEAKCGKTEGQENLLPEVGEKEGPAKDRNQLSSQYRMEMERAGNTFQWRIPIHIVNCLFQLLCFKKAFSDRRHAHPCQWWCHSFSFQQIDFVAHDDIPYSSAGSDDVYKHIKEAGEVCSWAPLSTVAQ